MAHSMIGIDYDWSIDPQAREPQIKGVCAWCGEPITGRYWRGWLDGDPTAMICEDCVEDAIDSVWGDLTPREKARCLQFEQVDT